jgi:hypothetical protein
MQHHVRVVHVHALVVYSAFGCLQLLPAMALALMHCLVRLFCVLLILQPTIKSGLVLPGQTAVPERRVRVAVFNALFCT